MPILTKSIIKFTQFILEDKFTQLNKAKVIELFIFDATNKYKY